MKSIAVQNHLEPVSRYGVCLGKQIPIEIFHKTILRESLTIDLPLFSEKCRSGCRNFGRKWCCPPHTPSFNRIKPDFEFFHVIFIRTNIESIPSSRAYQRVKIANVIMVSRLRKILAQSLWEPSKVVSFGSGSCRSCRPCKIQLNLPCKSNDYPRMSLESVGVDCQKLVKMAFGLDLEWYRAGEKITYTAVVGGVIIKNPNYIKSHPPVFPEK